MLHLTGRTAPLTAAEFRALLASRSGLWVWLDRDHLFFRAGDAVEVVPSGPPGGIAVVERDGLAMISAFGGSRKSQVAGRHPPSPRGTGGSDLGLGTPPLGWVRQIWRGGKRFRFDRFPWRFLQRAGAGRAAWAICSRLIHGTRYLFAQWRRAADPSDAVEKIRSAYALPSTFEACSRAAGTGLYESEQVLADRYLRAGSRLLDLGCGAGREAFGFAARGLRVTAVDLCEPLIEEGRRLASGRDVSFSTSPVTEGRFDAVYSSSDVYAGIPGRDRRVSFLAACRRLLPPEGILIVAVHAVRASLPERLLIDWPRRILRMAEAGDRRRGGSPETDATIFVHRFTDEREIRGEFEAAGFDVVERVGGFLAARPGPIRARAPVTPWMLADLGLVLAALPGVDLGRRLLGPKSLLAILRRIGRHAPGRRPSDRARLRRVIGAVDARLPGGGNCWRRSLLETALVREAAAEPVSIGLDIEGRGHAWMPGADRGKPAYDVELSL